MTKFIGVLVGVGAGLLAAGSAPAAPLEGWIVDVGGRVSTSPDYEGSDDMKTRITPTLNIRKANPAHRYTPPDPGATFGVISTDRVTAGPMVSFKSERKNDGELTGLRRVKRAAEVGGFVDVWPADWLRLHAEGRKGVSGHKGWVGDGGFDLVASGERWDASVGPRAGYASQRYMDTYFGVTPQEAALNPGISAAYAPSGGSRYVGARAGAAYYISDRWRAAVDASYQRLGNKAAQSPIVRTFGSRKQLTAGVSLAYSFGLPFGRD